MDAGVAEIRVGLDESARGSWGKEAGRRGGVGGRYILCEHATIVKIWLLLFLAFVYVLK